MRFACLLFCALAAFAQRTPTNLDFERGETGAVPAGWFAPVKGFAVELQRIGCHGGEGCAVISHAGGDVSKTFGNLMQTVDAAPYRGKAVRLRAWVRVDAPKEFDRAQMWFRVDRPDKRIGFFDNMQDRPIRAAEWRAYEISGEVADDAVALAFGFMSFGNARVWVDDVSLEIVPTADAGPEVTAAREEIQKLYSRMDAVYPTGNLDALLAFALPDAQVASVGRRMAYKDMIEQAKEMIRKTGKVTAATKVMSVKLAGSEATVTVESEQTIPSPGGAQRYVSTSRDVWLRTPGGWKIKTVAPLSSRAIAAPTDPETAKKLAAELKQRAVPVATAQAGNPYDDLKAFGQAVDDARIVALGEATHGTREIFQMKHRLLEYLVKEKGFTVFAIEANWPESLAVDRYVKTGEGDPKRAISGMYFWTWNTEEVLDMVEWMRAYNQAAGARKKLTFTSFDMQTPDVAARHVIAYLKDASPADVEAAEQARTSVAKAAALVALMDSNRDALVKASTAAEFRDARQAAEIVRQALTVRAPGASGGFRDEMMAKNTEWLLREVHPGEKIVLWAHNGHVRANEEFGMKAMGGWLRQRFGKEMYVLGFTFRGGELRAVGMEGGRYTGLANHTAPPAPEGSGDAVLSGAGMPIFFLDFRGLPAASPLTQWLASPHLFYNLGAMWARDPAANQRLDTLARAYDGIIFMEKTTAARGLPMLR